MTDGTVTATSLNLRDAPAGTIAGFLLRGATVSVLERSGDWLRISTSDGGQTRLGWVSAKFVTIGTVPVSATTPAAPIPPADDPDHPVTVQGNKAVGPDGNSFATARKSGFVTFGKTSLTDWLKSNPPPPDVSPSMVRVVRAASRNEGNLEAINSYDNAFISFGMLQWTAGTGDDPGELAAFLDLVQRSDADCFHEYFGRYGLGVAVPSAGGMTGFLTIEGTTLRSAADKERLRRAEWAYRFWRSGHDDRVRRCEAVHAAGRIGQFYGKAAAGRTVADWLTSEYGVALVLDEHVNRPGHVPGTLEDAIANLPAGSPDPAGWTTAEEAVLIQLYVDARDDTDMTDPEGRSGQIADCVHDGTLSDQRGSFQTAAAAAGV